MFFMVIIILYVALYPLAVWFSMRRMITYTKQKHPNIYKGVKTIDFIIICIAALIWPIVLPIQWTIHTVEPAENQLLTRIFDPSSSKEGPRGYRK